MALNLAAAPYSYTVTTPTLNYCKPCGTVCVCVYERVCGAQSHGFRLHWTGHSLAILFQRLCLSPLRSAHASSLHIHS